MHRHGRSQHVPRVREGGQGGEVAGQPHGAEGAAFGRMLHAVVGLPAILRLAGHLSVPGLDSLLLHGQGAVNVVKLEV